MPEIAILAIGDELLNGTLSDTNTAVIARAFGRKGFSVREARLVGDIIEDIAEAVRQLAGKHDVMVLTGGLGPTEDDLTAAAVATAIGNNQVLSKQALTLIDDYFRRLDRSRHERNRKSAMLPKGAEPLPNARGTAPGFTVRLGNCRLYSLPGVPDEMAAMLEQEVLPRLIDTFGQPDHAPERVLTLFGIPEPEIEQRLLTSGLPEGVKLAFGVEFPLVQVKLRAGGPDAAERLDQAEGKVESIYGRHIVARGNKTIAQATSELLLNRSRTLALAESCTGGLIGKMLTDIPGSSAFLERGAVTYSNTAKADWLGVPEEILTNEGAVSGPCARKMAEGIRRAAGTDYGLSVTGIAGPEGGTEEKPVGTVFIALAEADDTTIEEHHFTGDRERIRRRSACAALALLQSHLHKE